MQWYLKLHYYTEGHLRSSIVQGCKYLYDLEIGASLKAHSLYPKNVQFVQKKNQVFIHSNTYVLDDLLKHDLLQISRYLCNSTLTLKNANPKLFVTYLPTH